MSLAEPELQRAVTQTMERFSRMEPGKKSFEGLKPSELRLLHILSSTPEEEGRGITVSGLSSMLGVTSPSVTQVLNGLESAGLVERELDKGDRRVIRVKMTARGEEMATIRDEHRREFVHGLVQFMGAAEVRELLRLMNLVCDYMDTVNHEKERHA